MATVCASATDYTISKNFITIPVKKAWSNGAKTVRLQVIGSKIIRVEATAAETFPGKKQSHHPTTTDLHRLYSQ